MRPPSRDIAAMLEDEYGYVFGTDIFVARQPSEPDEVVTVYDTPGSSPALTLGGRSDSDYSYPSVQVRLRTPAPSYPDGYQALENIKEALHGRQGEVRQGVKYELIAASSDVAQLDYDDNNRAQLVLNFALQRTPV